MRKPLNHAVFEYKEAAEIQCEICEAYIEKIMSSNHVFSLKKNMSTTKIGVQLIDG